MATTEIIAAIELGSSKITGIAGKKNSDGSIEILSYVKENSNGAIRRGVIYNLEKTSQYLTSILLKMEAELHQKITQIYVGIGGQSTHSIKNLVCRDLDQETLITEETVQAIADENLSISYKDQEIQDVFPQEYKIDNTLQKEPVGINGQHIEGIFLNVVTRTALQKNIAQCFQKANLNIADILLAPVITANAVLSESEMRSGCALIDLGADTTTITVYKNNILRFLTVLPLGGNSITRDITSLQIEEEEAERIKQKIGNAILETPGEETEEEEYLYLESDGRKFKVSVINDIVEARTEEIVANIWNQIQLSGYADKLIAGLVLTGGGSNLKNIDTVLRKKSCIEKIRIARHVNFKIESNLNIISKDGTQNTLFGLLLAGKENCCEQEKPKQPETVQPTENQEAKTLDIFAEDENIKEQQNRATIAAQAKAEQEKRQKEEEKKRKEREKKEKEKSERWIKIKRFAGSLFDDETTK